MTGALQQFAGATIEGWNLVVHDDDHGVPSGVVMTLRLRDGTERDVSLYTLFATANVLHVRIDGMYVPPEELVAALSTDSDQ